LTGTQSIDTNQNKLVPCGTDTDSRLLLSGFQITRDLDLDLGSGHTAYRRASVIDLHLHTKCHLNRINFFLDRLTAGTPWSSRSHDTKT